MSDQWWSWILTIVGLTGFILAGRKVWWCWYVNIFCQALWFTYAIVTKQYGFIVASLAYTVVFSQNAYKWTKEHRENRCDICYQRPYTRLRLWLAPRSSLVRCLNCGKLSERSEPRQEIIDA